MPSTAPSLGMPARITHPVFLVPPPEASIYSVGVTGGLSTGLSANDTIFSCRTGTGAGLWVIQSVRIGISQVLAFGAAGLNLTELYVARSFTASDTGGIAATLTGNNGKVRTDDPTTTMVDMRVCDTATLTPGTRTLDAHAIASTIFGHTTTVQSQITASFQFKVADALNPPIILAANEGLVLRCTAAYAATGNWRWRVNVAWYEIPLW